MEIKNSGSKSLVLTTPGMLEVDPVSPLMSEEPEDNYKSLDQ